MLAVYYTNRGPLREDNQDALLVDKQVLVKTPSPQSFTFENGGIFSIADGVGGYQGGEIAASILTKSLSDIPLGLKEDEVRSSLISACEKAAQQMTAKAKSDSRLANMSSAAAGVYIGESYVEAFNCGDCRVYRSIKPYLNKLSHDHSAVQMLFDLGMIGEDDMRSHPRKNVITSSVGANEESIDIYFKRISLVSPLKLFICSDGVWETINLDRLGEIVSESANIAAVKLTAELYTAQASDNISFIILEL